MKHLFYGLFFFFITMSHSYANNTDVYDVRIKGIDYTLKQCLDPKQVTFTTESSIHCHIILC
jgi:hypothetical protein